MPIRIVEKDCIKAAKQRAKKKYREIKESNASGWIVITAKENANLFKQIRNLILSCNDSETVVFRKVPKSKKKRVEAAMDAILNG